MIYAIGDIHGELDKLERLLTKIEAQITPEDRLVFLGDYVDRGPDVRGVIELLIQIRENRPNTIFLRGNHEQIMLDSRELFRSGRALSEFDAAAAWFSLGGAETLASYPHRNVSKWYERVPENLWHFIESTRIEFRADPYLFVHAGIVPPGKRWTDADDPRLWIREPFLAFHGDLGAIVVFGHTPMRSGRPLVTTNKIGIDTGAAYRGPLTAAALEPGEPYEPDKLVFLSSA